MSPAMSDDSRYVSADVAAKRLKVSPATVRRRIRAGTLEGLIDKRPQGEVYLALADALPPDTDAEETEETPPASPDMAPDMAPDTSLAYLDAIMQLAERMETVREENAGLRERIGRTESAVDAYRRECEWLKAEVAEARRPWWRRLRGR
jgi:hypothetical protein